MKSPFQSKIEAMTAAGQILASALDAVAVAVKPGVSLKSLDSLVFSFIKAQGAEPAFLNYRPAGAKEPYPASICASVNEVVVHGTPGDYILKDGDIVSIDLGVKLGGFCTDAARTFSVGQVTPKIERLLKATKIALEKAIAECVPGKTIGDIGFVIQETAAAYDVFVIKSLTGHGVGKKLHEEPTVYNFGRRGEGMKLFPGLTIAIEPMFSLGSEDIIQLDDDSYATADYSPAAHFEHTIAITENKPLILTK